MKRIFILAGITVALAACGNSDDIHTNQATTDSSNHSVHQGGDTGSGAGMAHTAGPEASMMDIMHKNMQDMKTVQSTSNPDNDFAALMKVHHMGALDMAQLQVARGTDPQLKQMAQKMIDDQQREIAELNTFLSGHQAHGGGDAFYKESMTQMNNMKMDMSQSGSIDQQFAQMMIPHHQGGIDMARAYLKSGAHEEKLKTMANNIVREQQKEIQQLQDWLNKNNQR